MDWMEALEIVVARDGVERYRVLTSDQNPDVPGRERYRADMVKMAAQPFEPGKPFKPSTKEVRPTVSQSRAMITAVKACSFWSKCSCSAGKCALKNNTTVSYQECFECLKSYPN
jgi:hypothetical protein